MCKNKHHITGFSLIEMALVLVVIGLIAASVMVGKELIRASQIRGLIAEFEQYANAVGTFREIYHQLPGDFDLATQYWPNNSEYNGFSTADGNNDRKIGYLGAGGTLEGNEDMRLWQHLNAADVVFGEFDGVRSGSDIVPHDNIPSAPWENSGFWIGYQSIYSTASNFINFAAPNGANLDEAILSPQEAWQLDTKADDANPSKGIILIARSGPLNTTAGRCVTGSTSAASADFNLNDEQLSCRAFYRLKFFE